MSIREEFNDTMFDITPTNGLNWWTS